VSIKKIKDNEGRRIGIERRNLSYTKHIPNVRSQEDRRRSVGRRSGLERRSDIDRRSRKIIFKKIQRPENDLREGIDRRSGLGRRVVFPTDIAI